MKHTPWLVLFGVLLLAAAAGAERAARTGGPPAPHADDPAALVFIIPPVENVGVMYERFLPVKDHIERATGRPVLLKVARSHQEAIESIDSGQAQLAYLDPAAYCEARRLSGVEPLVKTVVGGAATSRSVIVTRSDSPITKIVDGRKKRLALGATHSSLSSLIPSVMFKEVGISLKDFQAVDYLEQEDRIALSVLAKRHDLGGLSEKVARKYLGDGLRIIKTSEAVPPYVVCACTCLPGPVRETLRKAFLSFRAPQPNGSAPPKGLDGFSPAEDRDFDVVRVMIRNLTGKNYLHYGPNTVKVAILPLYSAITLYERFDPLMRYLSRETGREFKLVIPRDFEDFFSIIERGDADYSYSNPYIYIQLANRGYLNAIATAATEESGDIFRGIIITHKDSAIRTLADLKGRDVMVVSFRSAGGFLVQKHLLSENGIDVFRDLRLREGKRQEEVILNVYRKTAEAGFVREAALDVLKEEIDLSTIRVLATTPYIPNWPFAASAKAKPDLTALVQRHLVDLKDAKVLSSAQVRGFKPSRNEDFDDLRKWIGRYETR
ncbi:MAG: PhnD/SsuA/transferrin family substrate-binding protein [Nitrospirota bacterium]